MRNVSFNNEYELLYAIATGSQDAFCSLFKQLKDKVFSFALHFTHSSFIAEEITQEVFMKLWVSRVSLAEVKNIEAWIMTVTKNLCFNHLKKKAVELKTKIILAQKEAGFEMNVDDYVFYKDQLGILKLAMDQLSPQQRTIFRLNREEGLKNEEIARQLNITPNTVKTHMVAALRKIRTYMQNHSVNIFLSIASLLNFIFT